MFSIVAVGREGLARSAWPEIVRGDRVSPIATTTERWQSPMDAAHQDLPSYRRGDRPKQCGMGGPLDPSPDGNQLTSSDQFSLVRDLLDELTDLSAVHAVVTEIGPDSSAVSAKKLETRAVQLQATLVRVFRPGPR